MKKSVLIAALMLAWYWIPYLPPDPSPAASAQGIFNLQGVAIKVPKQLACAPVTLGNATPTEVSGNTANVTSLTGTAINTGSMAYTLLIQNTDTTNDVFCSSDASVAASGSHRGWDIPHGTATALNSQPFVISPTQTFSCIGGAGTPVIVVCKQQ